MLKLALGRPCVSRHSHVAVDHVAGHYISLPAGYLLPVLQRLHQLRGQQVARLPAPHSIVLVPTPDLAVQVTHCVC